MLDRLTLDQLRILATVAETGSFSAAARKLGRVQSAISQSVQSLESTLGLPLFDREGKVPKLNDAGRVLLQDARRLARAKKTAVVLHPGPMNRGVEIADDVADGPQSRILQQVGNGVAVRMAVLREVLGAR